MGHAKLEEILIKEKHDSRYNKRPEKRRKIKTSSHTEETLYQRDPKQHLGN